MGSRLSYPEVDLSGKVAVVTGGNSGIGYETAKGLATMGAHTIIACRSRERAEEAIARMEREVSTEHAENIQVKVEFMVLDLASFQSTKEFTVAFRERNLPLHILINNAAMAWVPLDKTVDGYEIQLQVNHLSHFLLTLELLPIALETASQTGYCRIVIVSSSAHSWSTWEPENMNGEMSYSRLVFYPKSKLYNVMTAYALQRRLKGVGITVSALHPGLVNTNIVQGFADKWYLSFISKGVMWAMRSSKDGAATSLNCAVNPDLNSQQCFYYSNCSPTSSSSLSMDEEHQGDLWRRSIDMIKDYLSPEILAAYGSTTSDPVEEEHTPVASDETAQKAELPHQEVIEEN